MTLPSRQICDGLWRCLCPAAADRTMLRRAASSYASFIGPASRSTIQGHWVPGRRHLHSRRSKPTTKDGANRLEKALQEHQNQRLLDAATIQQDGLTKTTAAEEEEFGSHAIPNKVLTADEPHIITLRKTPDVLILKALRRFKSSQPVHPRMKGRRTMRVALFVEHLLQGREKAVDAFIFECLIDAMASRDGSAVSLRKLFQDMSTFSLRPSTQMCRDALASLALHPDPLLRREVLDVMAELWIELDASSKQSVLLAMLREQQYELAYTRLTEMADAGDFTEPWVYDIFIMVFGTLGYFDEALFLLHRLKDAPSEAQMITNLQYFLLDVCSQGNHYPGTAYTWINGVTSNDGVTSKELRLSAGIIESVLDTAARHGDVKMATEALDRLGKMSRAKSHHYEAVADAFAHGGLLFDALRILCIMQKNGHAVRAQSTSVIWQVLKQNPDLPKEAEASLRSMFPEHDIPLQAVDVVLEVLCQMYGSAEAQKLYNDTPKLCGEEPTVRMMQNMMAHSSDSDARRQIREQYIANVKEHEEPQRPPADYEELIPEFCTDRGLDVAFRFAMRAIHGLADLGELDPPDWLKPLVKEAIRVQDKRIWSLMDEFKTLGSYNSVSRMEWLLQRPQKARPEVGMVEEEEARQDSA